MSTEQKVPPQHAVGAALALTLRDIKTFVARHGTAPTAGDLASNNRPESLIAAHLNVLREAGAITDTGLPSLTPPQARARQVLLEMFKEDGPPSAEEFAVRLGASYATARYHLLQLEEKGAIRRIPGRARGIEIVEPA